jgi:hypothetical protein
LAGVKSLHGAPAAAALRISGKWIDELMGIIFAGYDGYLDTSIGLPLGDAPSPWQHDSRLAKAFPAGELVGPRRQLLAQVARATQFHHQRSSQHRNANLDEGPAIAQGIRQYDTHTHLLSYKLKFDKKK